MSIIYDMICKLNEENYEHRTDVDTLEELTEDMVQYFDEHDMFDDNIDIDPNNFKDEYGDIDELELMNETEKQMCHYINSIIEWEGKGEYCVVGSAYGEPKIMKVEGLLECELDYKEFPIPLTLELFTDTKNYILEWKKSEGYKYAYLISWICHVGEPWYRATHIVYSNEKIDDVINMLNNDKDIFIGEFNILGANYVVEEVEDFNVNDLLRYKFNEEYETIVVD